jgi:hypothetical protein
MKRGRRLVAATFFALCISPAALAEGKDGAGDQVVVAVLPSSVPRLDAANEMLLRNVMGPDGMVGVGSPVQKGPLAPRDECVVIPGAPKFRAAIARAVLARDPDALVALASEDITLSFGGDGGREELSQILAGDEGDEIWRELEAVLPLGCADIGGLIGTPWYWSQDDLPFEDAFSVAVVIGEDVPLVEAVEGDDREMALLSWEAVELLDDWDPYAQQLRVRRVDGTAGYVAAAKLRHFLDRRLIASNESGEWQITAFVAGD